MPEPTHVRVKDDATGHELTVTRARFENAPKGAFTVVDKPAVQADGTPVPPKYKTTVAKAAAAKQTNQKES